MQFSRLELKRMVASSKAFTVLEYLANIEELKSNGSLINQVFQLQAQISEYEKRRIAGTISLEDAHIVVNRINQATINLIDLLPEEVFKRSNWSQQKEQFEHEDWFKLETWIRSLKRNFVNRFNRDAEFRKDVLFGTFVVIVIIGILIKSLLQYLGLLT